MSTVDRGGHFFYFLILLYMFWNNPAKILGAKYEAEKKKRFLKRSDDDMKERKIR